MATRFGRRAADGTYEYHDSRESMIAAEGRENSDARAGLCGLIGLLVGGVLSYVALLKFGMEWPKWLRFALVIAGGGTLAHPDAYLAGRGMGCRIVDLGFHVNDKSSSRVTSRHIPMA